MATWTVPLTFTAMVSTLHPSATCVEPFPAKAIASDYIHPPIDFPASGAIAWDIGIFSFHS
jgi:hypothetical protein